MAMDKQRELLEAHTSTCLLRHCLIFHISPAVSLTYTGKNSNQTIKKSMVQKHEKFEHVAKILFLSLDQLWHLPLVSVYWERPVSRYSNSFLSYHLFVC